MVWLIAVMLRHAVIVMMLMRLMMTWLKLLLCCATCCICSQSISRQVQVDAVENVRQQEQYKKQDLYIPLPTKKSQQGSQP